MEDPAAFPSRSPTPSFGTAEIGRTLYPSIIQHPGPAHESKYLGRRATLLGWFDETPLDSQDPNAWSSTCVAVKLTSENTYTFSPPTVSPSLSSAVCRLDENAVVSISSRITASVIDSIALGQKSFVVEYTGTRIPIIPSLDHVESGLSHFSRACIVLKERVILVWCHEPSTILDVAFDVEMQLSGKENKLSNFTTPRISGHSTPLGAGSVILGRGTPDSKTASAASAGLVRGALDEKHDLYSRAVALEERGDEDEEPDLEKALAPRPVIRVHAVKISMAIMLVIITQALGVSRLLREYSWDGNYIRFALVVTIPPLALFSLFFFIVLVTSAFQLFLPASFVLKNSKFHSAVKPNPKAHRDYELPHITIQMPVYKEGLKGVIVPTMISVLAAVQYYEEQGGTASVFVNDDGMQVIQPELAEARKQYYRDNGIGYTARPPNKKGTGAQKNGGWSPLSWFRKSPGQTATETNEHGEALANRIGFERKGKFKKASNMNYGLAFSLRVEDEMARLMEAEAAQRGCTLDDFMVEDDDRLYQQALENCLAADEGKTWAEGNIRVGELILLIDCDTRVPVDCLLYGALEMHESPEVAILQHGSGVMQVVHNTFENGITYFTNVVYTAIKYGVGSGDVSPFVGHNAFLRWKALQSIQFVDASDGQTKWWSDSHVSEDFDVSLRVQMQGMTVRLATYHGGEFKEGVSLTLYDELTRWEKYAYGCNELVFHPMYQWIYRGPVTRLFLRFLWSNMPITSKVTIIAYIFTYYAIGAGMLLAAVNYILVGLFNSSIDHIYMPSWGIWCALVVVFNGFASVAFSMARHQLKEETFWRALLQAAKWLPFLIIYFGGISLNCGKAILCHSLSINLEWASTAKEMGPTGFYIGMDKMVRKFKWTWAICAVIAGVMLFFAFGAPWGWRIKPGEYTTATVAIVPLAIQICSATFLPFFLGLN
ncbi:glycosyl transferase family group 2-domain-containing protein [Aspergillus pseudoustus]|uniref:Glycosyl transferase family group 2-domain-containing protein n=1 Tax=Aspergillus pseudoustus TaxID=1810923 RepID=A0ABR4JG25_9EURO